MWTGGITLALWAADESASSGTDQLVVVVGGIVTAAIVAAGTVLVALINSRSTRTAPAESPADLIGLHERVAVLERRADDADERDDVQDRRLDQVEDHLDLDNPRWRRPDG